MMRSFVSLCVGLSVCCLSVAVQAKPDNAIAGRWVYQQNGALSEMVLEPNGNGSFDGVPLNYQVQGRQLMVSMNGALVVYFFELNKNQLSLAGGDLDGIVQFSRAQKPAKEKQKPAPKNKAGDNKGESLSRLLLSSDWCSFSYSGGGGGYGSSGSYGRSSTTRVHFAPNGHLTRSSGSENYSSNQYGSVAGQGGGGAAGRWEVRAGLLYLAEGNAPLQPVRLNVTRNSNGYPIINADGVEYMQCN